jgi:outer membrane protein assembly factor BamB
MLWSRQVGKPGYPAFGPGANANLLGIVSGSKLYVMDRNNGRIQWVRQLGSAPSSGPALSEKYAFVAMVTGRIEGYQLEDPATQPWYYQSSGRTYLRPTTTGSVVSWPTTEGYLYVSRANDPGILFRLETSADIVTSPAQMEPYLYIGSLDGYLYCVHQHTGDELWRYSTGYAIDSSPAIIDKRAYVASRQPAIHTLDATTGQELWATAGASHFAGQGKERVYASDRFGNLLVLDAKTGSTISRMPTSEGSSTLVNDQSNRIFMVNDRGLVQCLREIGATEPIYYRPPTAPSSEDVAAAAAGAEATPAPPTDAAADPPAPPPSDDAGELEGEADAPADPAEEPAAEPTEPMEDDDPFDVGG